MDDSEESDRREFERIPVEKTLDVERIENQSGFETELIDISLKGLLIERPEAQRLGEGEQVSVTIHLSDSESIRLDGRVVHVEQGQAGIEWTEIESDSFSHLKRFVEVNLGDPEGLRREIAQLGSGDRENGDEKPEKHMEGEGHAHHQFNPERAQEFHDPDRLKRLKPTRLLDVLSVEPDDQVLDLGTGSGALLAEFSGVVNDGVVVGADVNEPMLERARSEIEDKSLSNVVLVKNTPTELPLFDGTQDAAVIVSSLHELSDPVPMLREVRRVMKTGGQLGIVEWRHEETEEGPPLDHRLTPSTIEDWLGEADLRLQDQKQWTETGYDLYITETG